jgi:adenosylcobinamide hydrolase
MRYYLENNTLFIRGRFTAASTGISGGIRQVSTILNCTVPSGFDHGDPVRYLDRVISHSGMGPDYFGLMTAVEMRHLCVLKYDFVTVFLTAGVTGRTPAGPDTINIIVHSAQGMTDGAMLGGIITVTGAKAQALRNMGFGFAGTATDAVVIAHEGEVTHTYAGPVTGLGLRISAAVLQGIPEALKRHEGEVVRTAPSLFVYSRYGGEHWVEWEPGSCRYYPCHFPGQRCDFCYCPFYPCLDEELGQWVTGSHNGRVWNCSSCTLLHEPPVAGYLIENPEASLKELKSRKKGTVRIP